MSIRLKKKIQQAREEARQNCDSVRRIAAANFIADFATSIRWKNEDLDNSVKATLLEFWAQWGES